MHWFEKSDEYLELLLQQIKDGRRAKEAVLEAFAPLIRSAAREACRRLNLPRDCQTEVIESVQVRVFQGIETFRGERVPQFIEWVREIARNVALNVGTDTSKKRQREVPLDTTAAGPARTPDVDRQIYCRQMIARMMQSLGREERIIFLLKSLYEYTFAEIAELLDLSAPTVQRRYVAMVKRLQKKFDRGH